MKDPVALETENEQLKAQVNTLTGERDTARGQVTTLQTENTQLKTDKTTLTTQLNTANTSLQTVTQERDQLKTENGTLKAEKKTVEEAVATKIAAMGISNSGGADTKANGGKDGGGEKKLTSTEKILQAKGVKSLAELRAKNGTK